MPAAGAFGLLLLLGVLGLLYLAPEAVDPVESDGGSMQTEGSALRVAQAAIHAARQVLAENGRTWDKIIKFYCIFGQISKPHREFHFVVFRFEITIKTQSLETVNFSDFSPRQSKAVRKTP